MTLATGATVGRYQIVSQLGAGGMATVYKAFQPALDRYVALKVLRQGIMDDPDQRERFEREAKAIARLRHPNIVQVFDFDTVEGYSFLVIELIDGGTLKMKLTELSRAGQKLPHRDAARIIAEVGEALDVAHQQGIVHRDVKPSNVLMSRAGRAIMADFGIARILAATQQTQTGVGVGTPEYMSPEQGQGQTIDHRSDIYSLGVMAYELLTGRVPFHADTPLAVVLAHVRDPLPLPSTIDPTIGQDVERVLMKATAKTPAERYASAGEFTHALRTAIEAPPGAATPTTPAPAAPATPSVVPAAGAAPAAPTPARAAATARPSAGLEKRARTILQWQMDLLLQVVGLVFLALELLLIARIVVTAAPVELGAPLLAFVRAFTDPLVVPFQGLAQSILTDPAVTRLLDLAAVISLVVVFVVSRVIDAVGRRIVQRYVTAPPSTRW